MGLDNPVHIAFLVVILLLLFGAKRLPEIGRQLGSGMREFKDSVTGSSQAQQSPQQTALPQATQVAAPPAPAPAAAATVAAPQPAAPAPDPAAAPAPQPAAAEPTHQA
jgi:sec-independent protein translocase protein TatA